MKLGSDVAAHGLASFNQRLFQSWLLFVGLFIVLYGAAFSDLADFKLLVQDVRALHPIEHRQFLHSSPFTFVFGAGLVQLGFPPSAAYALISFGGFSALFFAFRHYLRDKARSEEVAIIIFSTPILLTLTYWVGKNDPYLLAAYLCVLRARSGSLKFVCVVLMAVFHRDISAVMLLVHCLVRRSFDPVIVAAAIFGQALIILYHFGFLPQPPASRVRFILQNMNLLTRNGVNPIAHLVFSFGWGWLFVGRILRHSKARLPILISIALCFSAASLTLDYTRVFILCSFPLMLLVAEDSAEWLRALRLSDLAIFIPIIFLLQFHLIFGDRIADLNWTSFLLRL